MAVSIDDIKRLRQKTLAGLSHCKQALEETNGDFKKAEDYLKVKGLSIANKKAGRETSEGLVGVSTDDSYGVMVELNSETDFVAKNENFQTLLRNIINTAHSKRIANLDELKKADIGSSNVAEELTQHIAIIGENIQLSRMAAIDVTHGIISSYVHAACSPGLGRIAAMIALETTSDNKEKLQSLGQNIAMHIVANKPLAISIDQLDPEVVEQEKAIIKEQLSSSKKPANVQEKIAVGKMNKYYSEVVLLNQPFVADDKITIADLLKQHSQELHCDIKIADYKLFILGDK